VGLSVLQWSAPPGRLPCAPEGAAGMTGEEVRIRKPDWDIDKARGDEAEELFRRLRSDILSGTVEVKRDDKAHETGNLFVETECLGSDGRWRPSGLATTKASTYVFVAWPLLLALPTLVLMGMVGPDLRRASCTTGSNPTRGVLLPLSEVFERAQACCSSDSLSWEIAKALA